MATTKKRATFELEFTSKGKFKDFGFVLSDLLSKEPTVIISVTGYESLENAKKGYRNLKKRLGFHGENIRINPEVKNV